MHLVASTIGQIFSPFFHALSWLLALYYSFIPNYVVAIALLTITVMIVSFPLNRASTRSMFKMQLLQPEVQKMRAKYKPTRDMSVQERQEVRQKLNEEMMALYRENNVSMAGGCLPNLVIFPIFIVLYDVVRGLTNTCQAVSAKATTCASAAALKSVSHPVVLWYPRYIIKGTALYRNLAAAHGKMIAFGINLASTVRTAQHSWVDVLPFVAFVLVAISLQYVQLRQMTGRSTQTGQAAQQMQAMQKFMPLIMAVIYINIPAAVNVYFVFSSLFRIGQQEWMYRRDPQIMHAFAQLKARKAAVASGKGGGGKGGGGKGGGGKKALEAAPVTMPPAPPGGGGLRGWRAKLAGALAPELLEGSSPASDGAPRTGTGASRPKSGTGSGAPSRNGAAKPASGSAASRTQGSARPPAGAKKSSTAKTARPAPPASGSDGDEGAPDENVPTAATRPSSNGSSAGHEGTEPPPAGRRPRKSS